MPNEATLAWVGSALPAPEGYLVTFAAALFLRNVQHRGEI